MLLYPMTMGNYFIRDPRHHFDPASTPCFLTGYRDRVAQGGAIAIAIDDRAFDNAGVASGVAVVAHFLVEAAATMNGANSGFDVVGKLFTP